MRIATWNVNSLPVRLAQVLDWLKQESIDVLLVQETKVTDDKFPVEAIEAAGYHVVFSGQKTYNGVAILAKQPINDVEMGFADWDDPQKRMIAATIEGYRFVNVYVPNGQSVDSDKYQYKMTWLEHLHHWLKHALSEHERLVVMGDFNIAPRDEDVHDPEVWAGGVLVSDRERAALQGLLDLGLGDLFISHGPLHDDADRVIYSWWDYRQAAFRRNRGLRIDLICASPALAQQCQRCWIDKLPRGWERPSDHTPVVAELAAG
jgi:exodeoxyribonuclease III